MFKLIIIYFIISSCSLFSQSDSLKYFWISSDYDKLINTGEELISKDSATAYDYILIANTYKSTLENQKALRTLQKGIKKYPNNNELKYNIANIYYKIGENKRCIPIIDSLNKNDSLNKKYLILSLKSHQKGKKYKEALDISNRLILIDSSKAVFQYKSAYFLSKLRCNGQNGCYF